MFNLRYWGYVHEWATKINSDGCTVVVDWYLPCCEEHDVHYYFARTINEVSGELNGPITFDDANTRLRQCIQHRSKLGVFNPISWIRWWGVKDFGRHAWNRHRERERLEALTHGG